MSQIRTVIPAKLNLGTIFLKRYYGKNVPEGTSGLKLGFFSRLIRKCGWLSRYNLLDLLYISR